MSNLKGKGYGNRGSVFVFRYANGEAKTFTSNAVRYEDAMIAGGLPYDAKLETATTFELTNGKHKDDFIVDFVWCVQGTVPSGKHATQYLVEKGAITQAQAALILSAPETRL